MLGKDTRARRAIVGTLVMALLIGWLWLRTHEAGQGHPPHRADSYEGSSGMGADGFGGFPTDPESP